MTSTPRRHRPAAPRRPSLSALLLGLALLGGAQQALAQPYPAAARQPVVNSYHGIQVSDDYQWLEDASQPAVKTWLAAQNQLSRAALDAVPGRERVQQRITELVTARSSSYYALRRQGGQLFAIKSQPPKQQALLVTLPSPDRPGDERVVLDPNLLAADGSISIDFYVPSPDGKLVAVSLSEKGSEDGSVHVFEVASGKQIDVVVPRVQYPTGGGSVAWAADSKGFFYTRYPAPGERGDADLHFYQQVWFHQLGQPLSKDRYAVGREFPRIAETQLASGPGGEVLATVQNGDGGEVALYLLRAGKGAQKWTRLAAFADEAKQGWFGSDGHLYLLSRKQAPKGQVLRVALKNPQLARAQLVLPEGEGTIQHVAISGQRLLASALLGGPSQLTEVDLKTLKAQTIALPPVSSVDDIVAMADGELLASVQSYTEPPAWYRAAAGQPLAKTALALKSVADYSDTEVLREFAVSKDGTRVPLNIIRRKGTQLNGQNPTILYGYGGYSVSQTPGFSTTRRVWLDHGGVYVIANLRGGGEYGETWHSAGNLTRKQNVFDDFIAAAEHLIARGYATPEKLAIQGGSNGGLLMGAALTQRPELFRAVHAAVGIYDMLRIELDPNGAFNVTEFGTVKDRAQFDALYAYSPFHKVKDGTAYPAVLMTTGDNDGRVNPAQSRKMIARLQAANPNGRPILLRTSAASGHGIGSSLSETIKERTDTFSFLFQQLGVDLNAR
ncbi:prolyl oligopeptidase family serine peptidase [Paucibacter sp. APW11]|uniref:prolyl oligopeptidase n=1 Tax=Roseateles aquae TaxID=3077235 RepID=A0ABU3PB20_9BURK|nr:prolyl oligopeptidase family serine peptidase [Paucibacter sp. APW11]MDT8999734.1 prolyl oligopeptidase family serine peptidase [Paucibacter sp. APW11]